MLSFLPSTKHNTFKLIPIDQPAISHQRRRGTTISRGIETTEVARASRPENNAQAARATSKCTPTGNTLIVVPPNDNCDIIREPSNSNWGGPEHEAF